jgi:hypothetical protein
MKKDLFKTAWYLFKNATAKYPTFSLALKGAWKKKKFQKELMNGTVKFSFVKKDNSVRKAVGKAVSSENYTYTSKSTARKSPLSIIKYFDVEKEAIRSFNVWQLAA